MSRAKRTRKNVVANDIANVENDTTNVVDHASIARDVANDVERNAIDALRDVAKTQTNDVREREIALLLHALYNDESLTSRDKKTIRRTLRDKYDHYISRERRVNASNVVNRILSNDNAS